jgi:hypothetical protein
VQGLGGESLRHWWRTSNWSPRGVGVLRREVAVSTAAFQTNHEFG